MEGGELKSGAINKRKEFSIKPCFGRMRTILTKEKRSVSTMNDTSKMNILLKKRNGVGCILCRE